MTAFLGRLAGRPFQAQLPNLAGTAMGRVGAPDMDLGSVSRIARAGVYTNRRTLAVRSIPRSGRVAAAPSFWFYNRIYILPSVVNFQAISQESTKDVILWNAFLSSTKIQEVQIGRAHV